MKSVELLKVVKEKKQMLDFFKEQRSRSVKINLGNLEIVNEAKRQIKVLCDNLKDGCREKTGKTYYGGGDILCGDKMLDRNEPPHSCKNCQEIKEICDAVHAIGDDGGKDV